MDKKKSLDYGDIVTGVFIGNCLYYFLRGTIEILIKILGHYL